jgi:hypothetical protein
MTRATLLRTGYEPAWIRSAGTPCTTSGCWARAWRPPGSHLWFTLAEFTGLIVVAFALATALFRRTASR